MVLKPGLYPYEPPQYYPTGKGKYIVKYMDLYVTEGPGVLDK